MVKVPVLGKGVEGVEAVENLPGAPRVRRRLLLVLATIAVLLVAICPTPAATFTVNATSNAADANPGNGVCLTGGGVCSLYAAIQEANLNAGPDLIAFNIPTSDPGYTLATGVFTITVNSILPAITDSGTVIDGTTQADTNLGISGTGFLGAGGTVGLGADAIPSSGDEPTLSQVAAPEIEITTTTAVRTGLDVQANNVTIRGVAIYGFGLSADTNIDCDIRVGAGTSTNFTGVLIEQNVIGSTAFNFTNPPIQTNGNGLTVRGADGGVLRNNLVGFVFSSGFKSHDGIDGWTIEDSEFRGNGSTLRFADGIDVGNPDQGLIISRNLLINNGASGLDLFESNGSHSVTNNSVISNGYAGQPDQETSGIRIFGTDSTITLNLVQNNFGPGILVLGDSANLNTPALRNRISQNSFSGNGSNAIDLLASFGDNDFGDGITANGGAPNDCSYLVSTGNDGLDTPVIASAVLFAGTTTVTGQACPNSEVEIYRATVGAGDTSGGTDYGEGERYLGVTTTNGTGDFTFVTTALSTGQAITSIVIDANDNTSEFGPNVPVTFTSLAIVKRAFEPDGTPIANGATLPQGMEIRFLIYIDNPMGLVSDVSVQDILNSTFAYQPGSIRTDNSLVSTTVCPGGICNEATIFAQVDASGTALGDGDAATPPLDTDEASYSSGTGAIDFGDGSNTDNQQLDIAGDRVWAAVFTAIIQ